MWRLLRGSKLLRLAHIARRCSLGRARRSLRSACHGIRLLVTHPLHHRVLLRHAGCAHWESCHPTANHIVRMELLRTSGRGDGGAIR